MQTISAISSNLQKFMELMKKLFLFDVSKFCKKGIFLKIESGNNYTSTAYVSDFAEAILKLIANVLDKNH